MPLRVPAALLAATFAVAAAEPFLTSELVFPPEKKHNHASTIVELPGGDLFLVWYRGSGERTADDVDIRYSRLKKGSKQWMTPRVIADTPNFPDCNPAAFVDSRQRLWILWPVIMANEWHTAMMKYSISSDYKDVAKLPEWDLSDNITIIPRNFAAKIEQVFGPALAKAEPGSRAEKYLKNVIEKSKDKYFARMGWMTRAHPVELPGGRIIVPLYSDGYSVSIMAISDDGGKTWFASEPLVGYGAIQASIARKKDGTLVAYMRDNGPAPKRQQMSESKDNGVTWSAAVDSELPNPGAGTEVITLRDGSWAMIYNDLEKGRHSLAVAISEDEGRTWKWKRHLENKEGGSFHYPSLIQARDGSLHASYSYFVAEGKSMKHARFNVEWVKAGPREP